MTSIRTRITRWTLAATLMLATGGFALEAAAEDRVDVRQGLQKERIQRGREGGSLTRGETRALRGDQRRIRRTEQRFTRNDGQLGRAERRKLERMQDRSSRHIRRAKHNRRE